ncbi:MAG: hypothetical protein MN733_01515, partial [Nitrososphaera sp.]|nr:hypothetical protein [Nitrososphaera sp.]
MINTVEEHFLSLLEETQSRIEWYVVDGHIRGRPRFEDDEACLCPITGVAWYLGYPLRQPQSVNKAEADLGLNGGLAGTIVAAADDDIDESDEINESGAYIMRQ